MDFFFQAAQSSSELFMDSNSMKNFFSFHSSFISKEIRFKLIDNFDIEKKEKKNLKWK